jgi:RNA polymerase sigma-70 factor (ECF subfamily)
MSGKVHQEDLMLAAQVSEACDMSNFEELYKRYFKKIYTICLKMTSNPADAEDLAQEVFIHIQRTLKSYRGDSSLSSWLHRVTVNHVLMRFRKKSVRSESVTSDGEMPDVPSAPDGETASAPMLNRIAISEAVSNLSKGYRRIFLMHDLLGYGHEEIARKLGISIGTSKSQLYKARLKMRAMITNRVPDKKTMNTSYTTNLPAYLA